MIRRKVVSREQFDVDFNSLVSKGQSAQRPHCSHRMVRVRVPRDARTSLAGHWAYDLALHCNLLTRS